MEQGSGATHRAPERAAQLLGAVAALRQQIGASIKGYSQAFVIKGNAAIVGYLWIRMHDAPPLHLLGPRHSMVPGTGFKNGCGHRSCPCPWANLTP
jgi:hypothetical protein